jgi:hypothetical protein
MASTNANSVNRLIEYPNTSITKKVPTSDSGMAITGMMTARRLPRKRKMTTVTMTSDSANVFTTSEMDVLMNSVES